MSTDLDRPYDTVLARAEAAEQENKTLRAEVERLQRLVDQHEVWWEQAKETMTVIHCPNGPTFCEGHEV